MTFQKSSANAKGQWNSFKSKQKPKAPVAEKQPQPSGNGSEDCSDYSEDYSDDYSSDYSDLTDNSEELGAGAGQFWHNPVAVGFLATMIRTAAKRRRMRQKSRGAGRDYVSAKNYAHMNEKKVE